MERDIQYLIGDATDPIDDGRYRYIIHCCNDLGAWGAGFVIPLAKKYPEAEASYRSLPNYPLGDVDFVRTSVSGLYVCNLIGQHGVGRDENGGAPIRYDAIYNGLVGIADTMRQTMGSAHLPRMGAGLAGGSWTIIEAIIKVTIAQAGAVYVYDLEPWPGTIYENEENNGR